MSRSIRLQDFSAHAGNVNCVKLGQKSAGVVVTGGDDKKVNVWTIGKTQCGFSLAGHSTPVMSVTFDRKEENVAAGAISGSIKLWDLEAPTAPHRQLQGHRSSVLAIEYNSQGDMLVSASQDTNVKIWDVRRKEATQTFKGHVKAVTHVKYSPDGRMLASGGEDGDIRVWDLVAGKLMSVLPGHTRAITGLQLHPTEYLLASSSKDKTVRLWDLETLKLVDTLGPEATEVRAVMFHPEGGHVLAALNDGMRVWSWEPAQQHDWVDVAWTKVSDVSVAETRHGRRLIGASWHQGMVGLWSIDLSNVNPFRHSTQQQPGVAGSRDVSRSQGPPPPSQQQQQVLPARGGSAGAAAGHDRAARMSATTATNMAAERRSSAGSGQSSSTAAAAAAAVEVGRRPGSGAAEGRRAVPVDMVVGRPPTHSAGAAGGGRYGSANRSQDEWGSDEAPACSSHPAAAASSAQTHANGGGRPPSASHRASSGVGASTSSGGGHAPAAAASAPTGKPVMVSMGVGVGDSLLRGQTPQAPLSQLLGVQAALAQQQQQQPSGVGRRPTSGSAAQPAAQVYSKWRDGDAPPIAGPRGVSAGAADSSAGSGGGARHDAQALSEITARSASMRTDLTARLNTLQLARGFLSRSDTRGAVRHLARSAEASASADVLNAMLERRDAFALDDVPDLCRIVTGVLALPAERQAQVGLRLVLLLLGCFGSVIRDAAAGAARPNGVDIASEQRAARSAAARLAMQGVAAAVALAGRAHEALRAQAKEAAAQLGSL